MGRLEYIPCTSKSNVDLTLDTDSSGLGLTGTGESLLWEFHTLAIILPIKSSLRLMGHRVLLHNTDEYRQTV